MYSVYVVNKTACPVLVRLQREKLFTGNSSFKGAACSWRDDEAQQNASALVKYGFCAIPPNETMPFPIDLRNDGPRKYASLFESSSDQKKLWIMDYEMNCMSNGCLVVKSTPEPERIFYLNQANPEPLWIPSSKGNSLLLGNIVKADPQVCFGRFSGLGPCSVSITGDSKVGAWETIVGKHVQIHSGEILLSYGHQFVRTKAGDLLPPHAVSAGITEPEGSLYLGRVGGNKPCSIIAEDHKIKSFFYNDKKVQSGEILVLKNGPNI